MEEIVLQFGPPGPKNANIVFPISVPVTHHGPVIAGPQIRPQILRVPASIPVQIDEPLAIFENRNFIDAVAIKITDQGSTTLNPKEDFDNERRFVRCIVIIVRSCAGPSASFRLRDSTDHIAPASHLHREH